MKNENGRGTITTQKRKKGTYYIGQVMCGVDVNGKKIIKTASGYDRKEVQKKLRALYQQYTRAVRTPNQFSLLRWMSRWLAQKTNLKESSRRKYERQIENHLRPDPISQARLEELSAPMLRAYLLRLSEKQSIGISNEIRALLCQALDAAMVDGLIDRNPCRPIPRIERPADWKEAMEKANPYPALGKGDQQALERSMEGKPHEMAILLALYTGARISELRGLLWSDVDWDHGTLSVEKQLNKYASMKGAKKHPETVMSSVKGKKKLRVIPLIPRILAKLRAHRNQQRLIALKTGTSPTPFILANWKGDPYSCNTIQRAYHTYRQAAGIPYLKFHGLRHTFATRMFEAGVPPKTVQELLGHTSMEITMQIYTHVMEDSRTEAMEKLDSFMSF